MRVMYVVFRTWGRMRMRMGCLRYEREAATALAAALAALPGMDTVEIRPFTGSILTIHDPLELPASRIVEVAKERMGVTHVVFPGEERPAKVERAMVQEAIRSGSRVARAATRFVEEVDLDVLRASNGSVNLGTLAALGFVGLGAIDFFGSGKLKLPPWHELWWRAYRTFTSTEDRVIEKARESFDEEIASLEADGL
ncbi:MAG TPA: hypothetical protein VN033_00140 [Vulgatibacter sp.]|nr:hypothetical protein [Vulgatibacter sp.]